MVETKVSEHLVYVCIECRVFRRDTGEGNRQRFFRPIKEEVLDGSEQQIRGWLIVRNRVGEREQLVVLSNGECKLLVESGGFVRFDVSEPDERVLIAGHYPDKDARAQMVMLRFRCLYRAGWRMLVQCRLEYRVLLRPDRTEVATGALNVWTWASTYRDEGGVSFSHSINASNTSIDQRRT